MIEAPVECEDCAHAAAGVWHGFSRDCRRCTARMAARSPDFARVRKAHRLDRPYMELLARMGGLAHDEVRAAADADRLGKEVE